MVGWSLLFGGQRRRRTRGAGWQPKGLSGFLGSLLVGGFRSFRGLGGVAQAASAMARYAVGGGIGAVGSHLMPGRGRGMIPGTGFEGYHYIEYGAATAWNNTRPMIISSLSEYFAAANSRLFRSETDPRQVVRHGKSRYTSFGLGGINQVWNSIPQADIETRTAIYKIVSSGFHLAAGEATHLAISYLRSVQKRHLGDPDYKWGKGRKKPIDERDITVIESGKNTGFKLVAGNEPYFYRVRMGPNSGKARAQEYGLRGTRVTPGG